MSTTSEIARALVDAGVGDVRDSSLERALYTSDASLYRVVPSAIVRPQDTDEVEATLAVCRSAGVPLTCRGAGTSIAGNAVGTGVVLDFSRYMSAVVEVDGDAQRATVEPGVVHAQLQRAAVPLGLRFGPDPSTHTRCTIGGMVGNNACGTRALAYGRTSDNVLALDVLTADGRRLRLDGSVSDTAGRLSPLRSIAADPEVAATIRGEFGRFGRQVSGYALEHLLPAGDAMGEPPPAPDVRRLLVGSEGTLAIVLGATVRLVEQPRCTALVVLGYPDVASAADAVPAVLSHRPTACEGLDARITDALRSLRGPGAVPPLPRGSGWLFVEVTGESPAAAAASASEVARDADALDHAIVLDPAVARALMGIREDGAGLSGRSAAGAPAYPGWEDSAVPPQSLGAYLRSFDELLDGYGIGGYPYGHFGSGCLHIRLDFPLDRPDGRSVFRSFLTDAAKLVASFGGSLSGEHGDGRARSELLPLLYSASAIVLFAKVKEIFDAGGVLNPGVLVGPRPVDADLRVRTPAPGLRPLAIELVDDGRDFGAAAHRCTGVGSCRADTAATGGVMCPSYLATREERDSTRGRARVLQEMTRGSLVAGGWRSPEVRAVLDLCLSCKACSSECPAGVDMASYKAEVLHQVYRGRLRPRAHYTIGWLPRWARLASRAPWLANAPFRVAPLARVAKAAAGIDRRRSLPRFATRTFRSWFALSAGERRREGSPVILFVDTFTDHFSPEIGMAATQVLEDAGFTVSLSAPGTCCALTWISTGQLDAAKRVLGRTIDSLDSAAASGVPVVGLEPSCTAVLRSDASALLGTEVARAVASSTRTLGELLAATPRWSPPRLDGTEVVAQPHCHHSAVMGWDVDAAILREAGATVTRVGGCCGLAGNFGVERGHYEISVAVANSVLLPAVRSSGDGAVVLADGFSCRVQLQDLAGRDGVHLAQLLAR